MSLSFKDITRTTLKTFENYGLVYKLEKDASNGLKLEILLGRCTNNVEISKKGKIFWKCFVRVEKNLELDMMKYVQADQPIYPLEFYENEQTCIKGLRSCTLTGVIGDYFESSLCQMIESFLSITERISADLKIIYK